MMAPRGPMMSVALFVLSVAALLAYAGLHIAHAAWPAQLGALAFPVTVYVVAHALRAIRLGVLLGADRARNLLGLYFYTAGCSAIIPFKLGELVRINEIAWWVGGYWRGLLIVWIERVFDVVALGAMAYFILASGAQEPKDIGLLLWVIAGFVFMTMLVFFVVPEQLSSLNLHVIRNYSGRKAIRILHILDSLHQLFDQVRPLLKGKVVTLALLTFFIWSLELLAMALLFESNPWLGALTGLVQQFVAVLSDVSRTTSLAVQFETIKIVVLLGFGVIALLFYGRLRVRSFKGMADS
ncbi:hypothetical protein [Azoarcus sp. KH32C]|uniref:hypothetical protein n=1 Tax=Azoarcus sp. KH32C TaxID=748247 RepID=UPI0002386DFF|nr:hypothetical protein [Azoarcus sp. KH32C]BAL26052.1 hypothetical protein AZKH_3768 [Azoarcus sp. KH32C]